MFWAIDMNAAGRSFFLLSFLLFISISLRSVLKTPAIGLRATWAGCPLQIGKWIATGYYTSVYDSTVASKNKDLDGVSIVAYRCIYPDFNVEADQRSRSFLMRLRPG